MLCIVMLLVLG
ncbi:hypothetical protein MTR67_024098 [Solanum verrucosum]|uniref:Uncharacterized protein n=1 Tax=Solanum verrucosum TaxID=315347 RepID=A0AAF0TYV9_SOLVR|nr:hypothetical protein MTR67_024098 [Solanum verrucosum]